MTQTYLAFEAAEDGGSGDLELGLQPNQVLGNDNGHDGRQARLKVVGGESGDQKQTPPQHHNGPAHLVAIAVGKAVEVGAKGERFLAGVDHAQRRARVVRRACNIVGGCR